MLNRLRIAQWCGCMLGGLLLDTAAVYAQPYGQYLSIGAEVADVDYTERVEGRVINSETGSLWYGGLAIGYRQINDLYLEASFKFSSSSIGYEGLSQFGQPLATQTQYDIADYRGLIGRSYSRGAIYVGLGRGTRERNIRSTEVVQGLIETRKTLYGLVGADLVLYEVEALRVKWSANLTSSFHATLEVQFPNELDDTELETGRDLLVVSEIEFLRYLPGHWSVAIAPTYSYGTIRRSNEGRITRNGEETGITYVHPETRMNEFGLRIAASRYF